MARAAAQEALAGRRAAAVQVLDEAWRKGTVDDRTTAIKSLRDSTDAYAVELYAQALDDVSVVCATTGFTVTSRQASLLFPSILKRLRRDDQRPVVIGLLAALGRLNTEAAVEVLGEYAGRPDRMIMSVAFGQLSPKGSDALPTLSRLLSRAPVESRVTAANVVGKIGGQRATEILSAALSDEDETVRNTAALYLVSTSAEARRISTELWRDSSSTLGVRAAVALASVQDPDAAKAVRAVLRSAAPELRYVALRRLTELRLSGFEADAQALVASKARSDVKSAALDYITIMKWTAADAVARQALHDPDLRLQAAGLLLASEDAGTWEVVRSAVSDRDPATRRSALDLLAATPSAAGDSLIAARLGDEDWNTAAEAARALGRRGARQHLSALAAAFRNPNLEIALAAGESLLEIDPVAGCAAVMEDSELPSQRHRILRAGLTLRCLEAQAKQRQQER
jgi:HEAT repeat protein